MAVISREEFAAQVTIVRTPVHTEFRRDVAPGHVDTITWYSDGAVLSHAGRVVLRHRTVAEAFAALQWSP